MHFYQRITLPCLGITLLGSVFVFYLREDHHQDDDFSAFKSPLINNDKPYDSIVTENDLNKQIVRYLKPSEAAKMVRDLGFDSPLDFSGFDNQNGTKDFIVPNVIHYVRFEQTRFTFIDYICLLSAYFQQRPDYIFIHTNLKNGFKGKYWRWILEMKDLALRMHLLLVEPIKEIFGQKLSSKWGLYHGSDIERIRILMTYGGIYLDNDLYVVQSLDKYRKFEMVIGWPDGAVGNQIFIAHKNARFLPLWLDCYHEYHIDKWYYNAGVLPVEKVLSNRPYLVHGVVENFGVQELLFFMYHTDDCKWPKWRKMDTVHLLINHRWYLDPHFDEYPSFNERNVAYYPYTVGEMARVVMRLVAEHQKNSSNISVLPPYNHVCLLE